MVGEIRISSRLPWYRTSWKCFERRKDRSWLKMSRRWQNLDRICVISHEYLQHGTQVGKAENLLCCRMSWRDDHTTGCFGAIRRLYADEYQYGNALRVRYENLHKDFARPWRELPQVGFSIMSTEITWVHGVLDLTKNPLIYASRSSSVATIQILHNQLKRTRELGLLSKDWWHKSNQVIGVVHFSKWEESRA